MSIFGVILVLIFPHLDRIRRDTPYLSVFSPSTGKCGPEQLRIRNTFHTVFTQWPWSDYLQILCTDYYLTLFLRDWLLLCAFLFTVRFFFIVLNDLLTSVLVVVRLKQTVDEQSKFTWYPHFLNEVNISLRKECPNTELFLVRTFLYSVRIQDNTDHKKLRILASSPYELFKCNPLFYNFYVSGLHKH